MPSPAPRHVALFVTCMVDQIMPEVGVATLRVLQRAGLAVDFPSEQTCCGQPFFNSGFHKETVRLARHTIETFESAPEVVLPGGSCTAFVRAEYPHLFDGEPEWQARAEALAAKTYELSEYLVHRVEWEPAVKVGRAQPVTYHDSCHMCRILHLKHEPRAALEKVGAAVHEMDEPDRCCGFGGLFSVRMPEASNAMTADKLRRAAESGAATVVTADPGCLMQMRGMAEGVPVELKHLAVVLEEATR